jgi:hypothetical protein
LGDSVSGLAARSAVRDVQHYRDLGREQGLAAGLAAVLAGLDVAAEAPEGFAVLPAAGLPEGAGVLTHPFAALEGLALVRFPTDQDSPRHAERGRGLTGPRAAALAAVRIGVLDRMADAAVERLAVRRFGGVPLIDLQFVAGALADVAVEIELAMAAAEDGDVSDDVGWSRHERLTEAGWTVARLFGAEGFLTGHPARSLHLSALVADSWVARPSAAGEDR